MKVFIRPTVTWIILLFNVSVLNAQVIVVNHSFNSDTTFNPFSGSTPVYSLSMSGGVNLLSDSSLVRVVLIDPWGNHYMVFESYPLITLNSTFDTISASNETTFLDGAVCDSLRIDIINATLDLDSLKLDTAYIPNAIEMQALAKWDHDSVKIDIMNRRITEEHMYWRAGRTGMVDLYFQEKELSFGEKFLSDGVEYYKGGIFERFSNRKSPSDATGEIVSTFDWRSRHGANDSTSAYWDGKYDSTGWITGVRQQQPCNTCWLFSGVGAIEANLNLYYNIHDANNPHHADVDISEMDVWKCPYSYNDCNTIGGNPEWVFDRMVADFRVDEDCFNYENNYSQNTCNKCLDPSDSVRITDSIEYKGRINQANAMNDLRTILITRGPVSAVVKDFSGLGTQSHAMSLVGYITYQEGDVVYKGKGAQDPDIVLDEYMPVDAWPVWVFKNSWGASSPTFYELSDFSQIDLTRMIGQAGDIIWYNPDSIPEIQCSDEDGDGYYWWGVHIDKAGNLISPQQCNCPAGVDTAKYEDCDDSDPDLGPYNLDSLAGPLYECLPKCDTFSVDPYIIRNSDIIDRDRHFNRNLVINTGNTLVIRNCTVSFSGPGRLIVKQGAKLVVENATLTTKCTNTMWQGVEVWGHSGHPQTDTTQQGIVDLRHGSVIEKARIGVTTVNYEYVPERDTAVPVLTLTGGIVRAEEATFRNNKIAIEFYPYDSINTSWFKKCSFQTTPEMVSGELPEYFIKMLGVHGVNILSCSFVNTRNSDSNYFAQWGGGIYSFNSSIQVDKVNFSSARCKFQKLERGVYALNSGGNRSVTIENTDFVNNYRAIYLSGMGSVNPVRIVLNDIQVQAPDRAIEQYPYGLYLDYCTGYKVEANTLWSTTRESPTIGLIVNNSGSQDNLIYRNTFKILYSGIIAQNRNRNSDGETGLQLKCNVFSGLLPNSANQCQYDIAVTVNEGSGDEYGIRKYQGSDEENYQAPAGNVFSNDSITGDQWQYLNYSNFVEYWYNSSTDSGEIVLPTRYSVDDPPVFDTTANPNGYMYIYSYSCQSDLDDYQENSDSLRNELKNLQYVIDSVETILSELIDGGSTEFLNNSVLSSWPEDSIPLRNDLLSDSPYLSDSVMISSIQKEDVLSSEMITEILTANPHAPKLKRVMDELNNRYNQLTDEQWFTIVDGLNIIGVKEELEMKIASHKCSYTQNLRKLIRHYKLFYPELEASDSIIDLLTTYGDLISFYEIMNEYLSRNDTINAVTVYNSIPNHFELTERESNEYSFFGDYLLAYIQMIKDGDALIPDSASRSVLYSMINDNSCLSSAFARAILTTTDTLLFDEPIVLPNPGLKQATRIRTRNASNEKETLFTLFPNPASSYIIAQFKEFTQGNDQCLEFIDMHGKSVKMEKIPNGTLFYVIDISALSSGCYLSVLKQDGKQFESIKFCIIH